MRAWLKAVHYTRHSEYAWHPGEDFWISDPGRRNAKGERVVRKDGEPWGEPSWKLNDMIGMYFTGTLKVPVLAEVIAPPEFDPATVQLEGAGEPDAGERWPWVTWVRGISRVALADAPTLDDLGIEARVMQRRPKRRLNAEEYRLLQDALS
jgi:hypothetical protein